MTDGARMPGTSPPPPPVIIIPLPPPVRPANSSYVPNVGFRLKYIYFPPPFFFLSPSLFSLTLILQRPLVTVITCGDRFCLPWLGAMGLSYLSWFLRPGFSCYFLRFKEFSLLSNGTFLFSPPRSFRRSIHLLKAGCTPLKPPSPRTPLRCLAIPPTNWRFLLFPLSFAASPTPSCVWSFSPSSIQSRHSWRTGFAVCNGGPFACRKNRPVLLRRKWTPLWPHPR